MEEKDLNFIPFSDAALSDMDLVNQHRTLISRGNYTEASALMNENYSKGFKASLINGIIKKVQTIGLYLLNLTANPEEYYSIEEPDPEWMAENGKLFWIKPI